MFHTFNGLPLHPLVVHAIVVLLPIAAIGTIAIAFWPRLRRRYGWLVVAAGAASTVLIPVATQSGEYLERQVGDPGTHAQLGDQLIWFAIPLLVTSAALVLLDRRQGSASQTQTTAGETTETTATKTSAQQPTVVMMVAGLAVVAAVATSVQIYRVGDSGARAAWRDTPSSGSGSGAQSGNAD